jgi:hypothetical protein
MDINERKSMLRALMHLSEVYSRFGNIPHFSVAGCLVMGAISAMVEWFWFSNGGELLSGMLLLTLIFIVHWELTRLTRSSVLQEISRLLARYPARLQYEYQSLLRDIDAWTPKLPSAISGYHDSVLIQRWGSKLRVWAYEEYSLQGSTQAAMDFSEQPGAVHAETAKRCWRIPITGWRCSANLHLIKKKTRRQTDE